jgi:hypothetical protein
MRAYPAANHASLIIRLVRRHVRRPTLGDENSKCERPKLPVRASWHATAGSSPRSRCLT